MLVRGVRGARGVRRSASGAMSTQAAAHGARPIAVFDLDGTLVDTKGDIARAANLALGSNVDASEVRAMVGGGARNLMTKMLQRTSMGCFVSLDEAMANYLREYRTTEASTVYPGVRQGLDALARAGIELAICTNKPHAQAVQCVAACGLGAWFPPHAVHGQVDGQPLKPDVAHLARACGGPAPLNRRACLVGDGVADVVCAKMFPMAVVAAAWGNTPREALLEHAPDALADDFAAAVDAVFKLLC